MKRKFAVFDIDGTFYRGSLYLDVVEHLVKNGLLDSEKVAKHQHQEKMWRSRRHKDTYNAYLEATVETVVHAMPKLTTKQVEAAARDVVSERNEHVYRYTRDLIASLKEQGYFLIAISGSQHEVVSLFVEQYGFDAYTSTEWHRTSNGKNYTGDATVRKNNKEQYLKQMIDAYDLTLEGSIAVGDSAGDITMLDFVENPIAFNPEDTLYETAKEKGWKIVVERKNVIYELTPGENKSYSLLN